MHKNVFTYVYDIVVTSKKKSTPIDDLTETLANMREAQLELNLKKCVFDIQRGKVLGCLMSVEGIEANLDKINAIVHMNPPQSKKEVQKLTDRIAALNRFISKLVEQSLPFFIVLRGSISFHWGPEQQQAFDQLKEHIQKLPTLSSLHPDRPLIMYVSASHTIVSGDLMQEKEKQKMIIKYPTKSQYTLSPKL
jgi:hypothetical protein